jgi:hypothetical protein
VYVITKEKKNLTPSEIYLNGTSVRTRSDGFLFDRVVSGIVNQHSRNVYKDMSEAHPTTVPRPIPDIRTLGDHQHVSNFKYNPFDTV